MKKRLKLPNGFGSITCKSDGRRRKPYIVRKTIGGKQTTIGHGTNSLTKLLCILLILAVCCGTS